MFNPKFISFLLLYLAVGSALSAPTLPTDQPGISNETSVRVVGRFTNSEQSSITRPNHSHGDFVVSDDEYNAILERLQRETYDSIAGDPRNYVAENLQDEELARLIEQIEQPSEVTIPSESTEEASFSESASESSTNDQADECPICLEEAGFREIILDCGHKFHPECILRWLKEVSFISCTR